MSAFQLLGAMRRSDSGKLLSSLAVARGFDASSFAFCGVPAALALACMKGRRRILSLALLGCLVSPLMFSACQGASAPGGGRPIIREEAMSFPFDCESPFLFAVYHLDKYPPGNADMSPNASLKGHRMGADFGHPSGWNMSPSSRRKPRLERHAL